MAEQAPDPTREFLFGDASTELSANRTAMSFERTRLSSDRTLMSVMRTSISLIGFGFTIFQVFQKATKLPGVDLPVHAPRNFGMSLIAMGVVLLAWGLLTHFLFGRHLHERRVRLQSIGLIRHADKLQVSMVSVIATLLLLLGMAVFASLGLRVGPFD